MYSTEPMSVATIIGVSAGGAIIAAVAIVVLFLCGKCVCIKEVGFFVQNTCICVHLFLYMCYIQDLCIAD